MLLMEAEISDKKPLCFVVMPFGIKPDNKGREIDFNHIYEVLIKKAIEACGMEPLRADEELLGGTVHKPMFERLVLCKYAIVDLTSLNANVFYELGLRHAIKEYVTIPIFAFDDNLPFNLNMQRVLPYDLDEEGQFVDLEGTLKKLINQLNTSKTDRKTDSPVFQLVEGWKVSHNLSHEKTDAFRDQAEYDNDIKDALFEARNKDAEAVLKIYERLKPLGEKSVGVVVDLFLSLRAVKAWPEMIDCYNNMDKPLRETKMIQEQLGFAYNRAGEKTKAERTLEQLIDKYGFDPETNGILGRVYKDLYFEHKKKDDLLKADAYLAKSVKTYKEGFDADWRDAYPGVNLVTMLQLQGSTKLMNEYLPIVSFAVKRKLESTPPDYWDKATQAELSVLAKDYETATADLTEAITLIPDKELWMLETTLNNFELILAARADNDEADEELESIIKKFKKYV